MSQRKNDKLSYKYVVAHILQTQMLSCFALLIIQAIAFTVFLSKIPTSMTTVDIVFLSLMVLTFYCSAAFIYVGLYKEKLETGKSNPIWLKRFQKMMLFIIAAVAIFAIITTALN
ncbi:TPA: hypothetical protein ACX6R4_000834 [Photobacterium damselae]